jgi:methyltransferase (TIGR00027 family)
MTSEASHGLSITAKWTAAARACESERSDALFSDPWAGVLAGEGMAWLKRQPPEAGLTPTLRTRFLDDLIDQCLQQTAIRQVVLIAAGLDMRAYRITWPPGTSLFEIDHADVLTYKEHILAQLQVVPLCQRLCLPADLAQPWADTLVMAGFQRQQATLWIVEGLFMYLETMNAQQVMETISQLACPGSWLGLDLIQKALPTDQQMRELREDRAHDARAGRFGVDEPQHWLGDFGWTALLSPLEEIGRRYGRWLSPTSLPSRSKLPRMVLIAAQREEAKC